MKLARALRCCFGFDVVVGLAIFAGIVAAAVPAMADSSSARRGAMAASMISLGNAQGGYNISVLLAGTGSGSVVDDLGQISCEADCNGNYGEEVEVTLTANAAPGSYFAGWSGSGCAGTGPCVITVPDSGAFVTATFELNPELIVDFEGSGFGGVTSDASGILGPLNCPGGAPCSDLFPVGSTVTLTPQPIDGSFFFGWTAGPCAGSSGPCTITMPSDSTPVNVTARFDANPELIVNFEGSGFGGVTSDASGILGPLNCPGGAPCSDLFPVGSTVTLTPQPIDGSFLFGWTAGPCAGSSGPCTITMPSDSTPVNVTARFDANPELIVNFEGSGFGGVTSDASGILGPLNCPGGAPCSDLFPVGSTVTLTPQPIDGSFFFGWTAGPCAGSSGPCTITMPSDSTPVNVTARFDANPELIVNITGTGSGNVAADIPGNGGPFGCDSAVAPCSDVFPRESVITLTAAAAPGNWFEGWTAGPCSGTDPCQVTMPNESTTVSVTATFRANTAPTAVCQPLVLDARSACISFDPLASAFDGGSTDPDLDFGDVLSFSVSPQGPYPLGITSVTLTVTDEAGESDSCETTVEVLANDCNGNGIADTCDVGDGTSLDCNDNWVPDECECFWCNVREPFGASELEPDVNAQLSHLGGGTPCGEKVADDFYLEPGCVHRITAVRGRMLTTSYVELLRARVELYEDCDGKPVDEPFFTADYQQDEPIPSEVLSIQLGPDGLSTLVTYRFDLCDECIWLEGGKTYWVSIIGLTDNIDMVDLSYWVAGDERLPLLGSIPVKRSGTPGATWGSCSFGPWESIEDCCIGCVNMDFCVDGYSCPIIWDNGDVDLVARGGSASGAHQQYNERTADSFVVKTCRDEELCLIEAWIWTNCDPAYGFIEFYEDLACGPPKLEDEPFRRYDGEEVEAKKYDDTWVVNGRTYHLWRLQVKAPDITLLGGHNYWLSAGAVSTGNFNTNSFFAWSKYGCDPCNGTNTFRITPGQHRTLRPPATEWADVLPARDFAFTIAAKGPRVIGDDTGGPDLPIGGTPDCVGDANNDGNVAVDDIFTFLAAWFAGCP